MKHKFYVGTILFGFALAILVGAPMIFGVAWAVLFSEAKKAIEADKQAELSAWLGENIGVVE